MVNPTNCLMEDVNDMEDCCDDVWTITNIHNPFTEIKNTNIAVAQSSLLATNPMPAHEEDTPAHKEEDMPSQEEDD